MNSFHGVEQTRKACTCWSAQRFVLKHNYFYMVKEFVNKRFVEAVEHLIATKVVKNKKSFAQSVGISSSKLSEMLKLRMNVGVDVLKYLFEKYGVRYEFIFDGTLPILKNEEVENEFVPNRFPAHPKQIKETILVATQDSSENRTIPMINYKAAANFTTGFQSQEFFEDLPPISLPRHLMQGGEYRCLQITGDSMHPTVYDQDWVICRRLEPYETTFRLDNIYVVVSDSRGINLKRLQKKTDKEGNEILQCLSDNPEHAPFELEPEDVLEIWKVEFKFSDHLHNENEVIYHKLTGIETELASLKNQFGYN